MKVARSELLVFAAGVLLLAALTGLVVLKLQTPPDDSSADGESGSGFSLPDNAAGTPPRLDGLVFSVDRKRKTVCAHDENSGKLVWESHGEDRFIVPGAAFPLDLSPDGELWVANVGKRRFEQLDPKTGRFIASWEPTTPFSGCCNPVRFAALAGGRFVTMEKGTRQACIYLPSGVRERIITQELSASEFNYYLIRTGDMVNLYDLGTKKHWEVPYDLAP